MLWGIGLLILGIILISFGFELCASANAQLFFARFGTILTVVGLATTFNLLRIAIAPSEDSLIASIPVEWVAEENAFREVQVSNTILKVYPSRDWLTFKKDGERYTIIEKGTRVLNTVKYNQIVEHYNDAQKTFDAFVKE